MFGHLVFFSVPSGFWGEIAILEPAGKRSGVVMDDSVLLQFGERDETFPTDAADVFPKVLTAVHRGKMVLK